jgi:hypothetical protein
LIYNEHSEGGLDAIGASHWELEEIDGNLLSLAASKLDFGDTNGLVTKEQFELFQRKIVAARSHVPEKMNYEPNIYGADEDTREGAAEIQVRSEFRKSLHAPHTQVTRHEPE